MVFKKITIANQPYHYTIMLLFGDSAKPLIKYSMPTFFIPFNIGMVSTVWLRSGKIEGLSKLALAKIW